MRAQTKKIHNGAEVLVRDGLHKGETGKVSGFLDTGNGPFAYVDFFLPNGEKSKVRDLVNCKLLRLN